MKSEHEKLLEEKDIPMYLHLTLHRSYFFGGLFFTLLGLASLLYQGAEWPVSQTLMLGILFLVSSYLKRIELSVLLAIGVLFFMGAFFHEIYWESMDNSSWKGLRKPAYVVLIYLIVSMMMWWAERRKQKNHSSNYTYTSSKV